MRLAPAAGIRLMGRTTGARHAVASGRGCAGSAAPGDCRYHGGCSQADVLIEEVVAGALLADRAHDTDQTLAHCRRRGIEPVIHPKHSRKALRQHDRQPCVGGWRTPFRTSRRGRGIATRHAKNAASFLAAIHIRCPMPWRDIS